MDLKMSQELEQGLPFAESYRMKMVEPIRKSSRAEREKWIKEARYNLFNLKSEQVFVDLLTDSGTGAMSDRQWGALMQGDESYAGSDSFFKLRDTVRELLGFEYVLPTHQGRAAENVLFTQLVKPHHLVPGNAHFDTTKGHIEFRDARAVDCTIDESHDPDKIHPFKGNVDLDKLEKVLGENGDRVPFVIVTITCNTAGGQPVSLQNLREVRELANQYNKPVLLDAARYAENAWFIQQREEGYRDKSIPEIVKAMFKQADMMTMSSKKDGIVNMGGFIAMRDEELYRQVSVYGIMYEGFLTYGGMAGRDMAALAQGLRESIQPDYLETRIRQVACLGERLENYGVPVIKPYGGHAIFVDADRTLPGVPRDQFRAQTLAIELYLEGGVRGVEIGTLMADRDPETGENRYPNLELLRLAVPRRVYTNNHMDYAAAALGRVYHRRDEITKGLKIEREAPILRHFTVDLARVE